MIRGLSSEFYASRSQYEYQLAAAVWLDPSRCPTGTVLPRDRLSPELRLFLAIVPTAGGSYRMLTKLVQDHLPREWRNQILRTMFDVRFDVNKVEHYASQLAEGYRVEERAYELAALVKTANRDYVEDHKPHVLLGQL